jgi:SagB-type dehydrogenase family enzyme
MRTAVTCTLLAIVLTLCLAKPEESHAATIDLPEPRLKSDVSIEETLAKRRSIREFTAEKLSMEEIGQLLWAAQGITEPSHGYRTAPSAGATYPIEIYFVTPDGFYQYVPQGHKVQQLGTEDLRPGLARVAGGQKTVGEAGAVFVITAVYERTAAKYRTHATRYVHLEAGHVAQNILLQAVALGLGSVPIGGGNNKRVIEALSLPSDHEPVYIVSVGKKQ